VRTRCWRRSIIKPFCSRTWSLRPDEQEQAMTPEEYESRLNRAIEMALTFQAAAAQGMDLTPEQKRRVDGIAQKHEATLQQYQKQGIT
jgi:hypothetical protein